MQINRRRFLGLLSGGVAGIALGEAIPFNRVWSFPSKIVVPKVQPLAEFPVGSTIRIRMPQRWLINVGDIISVSGWPGQFVVTKAESGDLQAYSPPHRLLLRGLNPDRIEPIKVQTISARLAT